MLVSEVNINTDDSGHIIFSKLSSLLDFDEGFIYFLNPDSLQLKYSYKKHAGYALDSIFPIPKSYRSLLFAKEGEIMSQGNKLLDIIKLDKKEWKGTLLPVAYTSEYYYDISVDRTADGF